MWWWRRRLPPLGRLTAVVGLLALLLGAGWVAAAWLSEANADSTTDPAAGVMTVTVHGKATRAGAAAAHARVVTRRIVRYEPTIETRTAVVTSERAVTHEAVLTQTVAQTITKPSTVIQTVTQTATETVPPVTVTQTLPGVTVAVTVTVGRH